MRAYVSRTTWPPNNAATICDIGYGLLLVFAFSVGLAGVLTGVGLAFIYARRFIERSLFAGSAPLVRLMPVASALVITCAGIAICLESLAQAGVSIEAMAATLR
ncbi:MAG: hypothetical protein MOB07_03065 [Acidobacteria bacterium]|nr:hypothetical protein [Acidobacteriota bacterium]